MPCVNSMNCMSSTHEHKHYRTRENMYYRVAAVLEIREIREKSGKMKKVEKVRESQGI